MEFQRLYDDGLAMASYLVGCGASKEAIIVDPPRDYTAALAMAEDLGLEVVGVAETHIHADFLSGARQMARELGATLYLSAKAPEEWRYANLNGLDVTRLSHDDTVTLGAVTLRALHTPGHTPEHLAYLVEDSGAPRMLLSGDFVFVGDVGRPDLLDTTGAAEDSARGLAARLYDSLTQVFVELPDEVVVWPGHGAGSACGKSMSQLPCTTVGFERKHAWWAEHITREDPDGFIDSLLDGQPETPRYFGRMKYLNRDGMPPLEGPPRAAKLYPSRANQALAEGAVPLDLRGMNSPDAPEGALRFGSLLKLSDHAGRVLSEDTAMLLIVDEAEAQEAAMRLVRVGLDHITGFIEDPALLDASMTRFERLDVAQARDAHTASEALFLDVRGLSEWQSGHVTGATHIHFGQLTEHLDDLPRDRRILTYCASGARATLAASILERAGFEDVAVFVDGFGAWKDAGAPTE